MPNFFSSFAERTRLPRLVTTTLLAVGASYLMSSCAKDGGIPNPFTPAKITVSQAGLAPEGVEFDNLNQHFLVSSRTKGQIGTVMDNGTYALFADDARLVSTIGLRVDEARHRLLAAVSDNGSNTTRSTPATLNMLAGLAVFDTDNGSLQKYIDLGALRPGQRHFANDITVDLEGNAYVTDSFSPIIYKVDPQGNASIFLENAALASTGFGLNGIVYHPDGYLLVAKSSEGVLFKVPIRNPAGFTAVTTSQGLVGADGLLLLTPKTLLLVSGSQRMVYRLTSSDSWATTSATGTFATGPTSPTTLARRDISDAYVLYPYQATAPQFDLVKVKF